MLLSRRCHNRSLLLRGLLLQPRSPANPMENFEPPNEANSPPQVASRERLLVASSAYLPTVKEATGGVEKLDPATSNALSSLWSGVKAEPAQAALYTVEGLAGAAALVALAPLAFRSIEVTSLVSEKLPNIGKLPLAGADTLERVSKLTIESVNGFSERLTALMTEREDAVMVRHMRRQIARLEPDAIQSSAAQTERMRLLQKVDDELEHRRGLLGNFINREVKTVFPNAVVPDLTVEFQNPTVAHAASYRNGVIYLKREDLATVGRYYRSLNGDTLSSKLLHEAKHGEQNGLTLRRAIDIATGGDTSGGALTKAELQKVKSVYEMATGLNTDEKIIQDVNLKRAGRILSPEDHSRAGALTRSLKELSERGPAHLQDKEELARLSGLYDQPLVGQNVEIQKALGDDLELASKKVADNHLEYKSWAHEIEAWAISKQVDVLVGKDQTLEQILAQCLPKE